MFDEKKNLLEEVIEDNTEEQVEEVQEQPAPEPEKPDWKAINLANLREEKERLARENEEMRRALMGRQQPQVQQEEDDDSDIEIREEELADGKHIKKLANQLKQVKQELRQTKQQSSVAAQKAQLFTQYPDFGAVVTADNFAALKKIKPQLAKMLEAGTDVYDVGVSAYDAIKTYLPEAEGYAKDKEIIARNQAKPKAVVNPMARTTPLQQAHEYGGDLTPEIKQARYEALMKRAGLK